MANPTTQRRPRFRRRVLANRWWKHSTLRGSGWTVPVHLLSIHDGTVKRARRACSALEDTLCHQHCQLAPASVPALPFLLELAETIADETVREDLLYLILGLVRGSWIARDSHEFAHTLWDRLHVERPRIEQLTAGASGSVAELGQKTLAELDDPESDSW